MIVEVDNWQRASSRHPDALMIIQGDSGHTWWDLRADVHEWLKDRMLGVFITYNHALEVWETDLPEQDALLFKLTWGGR